MIFGSHGIRNCSLLLNAFLLFLLGWCNKPCDPVVKNTDATPRTVSTVKAIPPDSSTITKAVKPVLAGSVKPVKSKPVGNTSAADSAKDHTGDTCNLHNVYRSVLRDSSVDISVTNTVCGYLSDSTQISYSLKVPRTILRTDSIFVPVYRAVPPPSLALMVGGYVARGRSLSAGVSGSLVFRRGLVNYGFDPFRNEHRIGMEINPFRR